MFGRGHRPSDPEADAPSLSGQVERHILNSLQAFKSGEPKSDQMAIIAKGLEPEDMADLAAHYSSIKITAEKPK